MLAGSYNMVCEQGTTFSRQFELQYPDPEDPTVYLVFNLTGYTARMQIRRTIESSTAMISLTTENNGISINGAAGKVTVVMTANQTAALDSSGVYDIELINNSGTVSRMVQGNFTLSLEVTK